MQSGPLLLALLGLEVDGFPEADDAADALSESIEAIESGGWSLAPYTGPAVQPYLGLRGEHWMVGLAPALSSRTSTASSTDGRTASLRTTQYRVQARGQWCSGPWLIGGELAWSDGVARLDGEDVAESPGLVELAPTAGARVPLGEHVDLVGRARWPIELLDGAVTHGLGGAVAIELHKARSQ